jgi:hypothetical protein
MKDRTVHVENGSTTAPILLRPALYVATDQIQYISINTTLFSEGDVCCLGQYISAHVWHLQVANLFRIILSCTIKLSLCLTN